MKITVLGKAVRFRNKYLALILTVLSLLTYTGISAQVFQQNSGFGFQWKRNKTDSTNLIPTFCGIPTLRGSLIINQAAIAFDTCNHKLYFYDPKKMAWDTIVGGGSSSGARLYQIQTAAGGIQTFTFTTIPASYADYVISVNGVIMRAGIDFTQLVNTITIPTITDGEYVEYRKIN